jgi:hypothetical protein
MRRVPRVSDRFCSAAAVRSALAALLTVSALLLWRGREAGVAPWLTFGGPLLELASPLPGERLPITAVELLVTFPNERVVADTFRCLLNGADVTGRLTLAENGAGGTLFPLREGRNTLRVEVFGRSLFDDRVIEDALEIEFETHPLPPFDRARAAPAGMA